MQVLLSSFLGLGAGVTNAGLLVAIGVLACVLGAEIAGICILVSKMLRAKNARNQRSREEDDDVNQSAYRYRGIGAVVLLGAIPQASYTALTVLSVLTAVAAVVFVVLLIVFRACGYDFEAPYKAVQKQKTSDDAVQLPAEEEEPTYTSLPDDEEQAQEAYTPVAEDSYPANADEPLSVFDAAEAPAEEEGDAKTDPIVLAPAASEDGVTTTTVREETLFADGTRPYKVVEKVVTETVKEVYRENPAVASQEASKNGTDAVMEKLADFLEYELQKRKENDQAGAERAADGETLPTFAASASLEEDVDEEDEDEDESEELDEISREEDEDVDTEEDDTEGDRFTGSERIIGFDEETGCYLVAHYRKSFEAKLIQSRKAIKQYYSELKNALLSYGGTRSRISWAADSFTNERTPIAKINVKTRTLELYLALDPASLEDDRVYKGQDVSHKKKYVDTPFRYKIRSARKLKWALELVQRTCEEHGLSPIDIETVDYEEQYPFDTTENLVSRKLIKEYIRQEKPATTFELAPDHVPEVPAEDESVIPANANFSWEFDNEVMEAEAEVAEAEATEAVEEVEAEEPAQAAEEPAPAEPADPAPSVFRETVKVTEMRYTERYYANGEPTYEQVITTEEPAVPMLDEPVAAEFEDHTSSQFAEGSTDSLPETDLAEATRPSEASVDPFAFYNGLGDGEQNASEDAAAFEEFEEASAEEDEDAMTEGEGEAAYGEEPFEAEVDEAEFASDEEEGYIVESEPTENAEEVHEAPAQKQTVNPSVALVDLHAIEEYFPMGAVIDIEALKEKELVLPSATTLKVYATAPISKSFTVEAHHFTLDAIQAIADADGDSVMVR